MSVFGPPPAEKRFTDIRVIVTMTRFQELGFSRVDYDDAAPGKNKSGGDAQFVSEDRKLVRPAIAIGIFTNFDSIMAFAGSLQIIRIIHRLGHPEPATFIPGHPNRLGDVWFCRKQAHREAWQSHQMLH